MRSLIIAAMLLAIVTPVSAEVGPVTCEQINMAIAYYGPARTLAWAKANGMSDARIERLKRVCKIADTF